jgi:hypothetical protein
MNVIMFAASEEALRAGTSDWQTRLGPEDHAFALTLGRNVTARGRWQLHPLELDLTHRHQARRLLREAATRWPSAANPAWRWLLARRWPDVVWNLRALDPDLVDLRWAPMPAALAARLAHDLAPIRVLGGGEPFPPGEPPALTESPWRRYDGTLKVSIVLPVYRGGAYLAQALDSCLAQTHANVEIVAVDDASPDETPDILAQYARKDHRVVTIRNAQNMKLPGALNVGFAHATGDLLTWTSHDNAYAPEAIETLAGYLCTWPDVDFVYSAYRVIDEAGQPQPGIVHASPPWNTVYWNPFGPCFLYRRHVYETTGEFRRDMEYLEDYEYWVRVAKRFRMMRLPWALYDYRRHQASMTGRAPDLDALRGQLKREHFGRR